jgi:hypothetical protein
VTDASVSSGSGITLWPAALAVWGPGSLWTSHAHRSLQVIVALTGTLRVRMERRALWRSSGAVLIPPDVGDEVDARGAHVLIAFLDPERDVGIPLLAEVGSDVTLIARRTVHRASRAMAVLQICWYRQPNRTDVKGLC